MPRTPTPHTANSEAEQALQSWQIDYTKRSDGTIFVAGDINLWNKNLSQLPDLSQVVVQGNFICDNNNLTSLQGAPRAVGGNFSCDHNQLKNLQGAPKTVGGYFSCSHNQLADLYGGPQTVGGGFWCKHNNLMSLHGAPSSVGGDFECYANRLTSLYGAPASVGGDFVCYDNLLTHLIGAPAHVGGSFWCENNKLITLKGAPLSVGHEFRCHGNPDLASLHHAPEKFRVIYSDWGVYNSWSQVPEKIRSTPDSATAAQTAQDIGVMQPASNIRRRAPKGP